MTHASCNVATRPTTLFITSLVERARRDISQVIHRRSSTISRASVAIARPPSLAVHRLQRLPAVIQYVSACTPYRSSPGPLRQVPRAGLLPLPEACGSRKIRSAVGPQFHKLNRIRSVSKKLSISRAQIIKQSRCVVASQCQTEMFSVVV